MNIQKHKDKSHSLSKITAIAILIVGLSLLIYALYSLQPPKVEENISSSTSLSNSSTASSNEAVSTESSQRSSSVFGEIQEEELMGKLIVTKERENYSSAEMVLRVPRLEIISDVIDYGQPSDLDLGPSMYEYSQLPNGQNPNVSITAHRDIANMEFYFIDRLWEGDLFYLIYKNNIYTYVYKETYVIKPDNWVPLTHQGKAMLTLISCHPLGTTKERIVVTADLKEVTPYKENFNYAYFEEGYEKPKASEDITFTKRDSKE